MIISSDKLDKLSSIVDTMMTHGWKPQGGVCAVIHPPSVQLFAQAIVKGGARTQEDNDLLHEAGYEASY